MMKYSIEEVSMAIGTEIEYSIPEQQWINYTKPMFESKGILKEITVPSMKSEARYLYASITVLDTQRAGTIQAPYVGIVDIPFIDELRKKKLYKLLKA